MSGYNKPDLNAPRYREESVCVLTKELYKNFIKDNPKYSSVTLSDFKQIIFNVNGKIYDTVISTRDGVELPEQLGYLFIGSCKRKKGPNTDYKGSAEYQKVLQHRNWESDGYVAKIFYTNYETKYRFKNHDLWGFDGVRQFSRTVSVSYPTAFKKYIVVDNTMQISKIFRKTTVRQLQAVEIKKKLADYDEFALE